MFVYLCVCVFVCLCICVFVYLCVVYLYMSLTSIGNTESNICPGARRVREEILQKGGEWRELALLTTKYMSFNFVAYFWKQSWSKWFDLWEPDFPGAFFCSRKSHFLSSIKVKTRVHLKTTFVF